MIRNLIIAASTAALFATASASFASAKVHVNVIVGGQPHYYPQPYPVYPTYPVIDDGYYGDDGYDNGDCGYEYITVKKWNRYHDHYRLQHRRVWVCN